MKSDPPPPPDYVGAAQQQGQQNVYAEIANSLLNRPNENTPYGSRTFTQTGTQDIGGGYTIPTYEANTALSPTGQKLFDLSNSIQTGMGELGQNTLDQTKQALGQPLDISRNRDAIVQAMFN